MATATVQLIRYLDELSVSLLDLPITVLRSYDTRRAHEPLDFGQGWSLGWRSIRVHENRVLDPRCAKTALRRLLLPEGLSFLSAARSG